MKRSEVTLTEDAAKLWEIKQEQGEKQRQMRSRPQMPREVLLLMYLGGRFVFKNHKTQYVEGTIYMKQGVHISEFHMPRMRELVMCGQETVGITRNPRFLMYFRKAGKNLTVGKRLISNDSDLTALYHSKDIINKVVLYVVDDPNPPPQPRPLGSMARTKTVQWPMSTQNSVGSSSVQGPTIQPTCHGPSPFINQAPPKPFTSVGPSSSTCISANKQVAPPQKKKPKSLSQPHVVQWNINDLPTQNSAAPSPIRRSPRHQEVVFLGTSDPNFSQSCNPNPNPSQLNSPLRSHTQNKSPLRTPEKVTPLTTSPASNVLKRDTPRVKHVATKLKARKKVEKEKQKKDQEKKVRGKKKTAKKLVLDEDEEVYSDETDSDLSDDLHNPGEEDRFEDLNDDVFVAHVLKDLQGKGKEKVGGEEPRWADEDHEHEPVDREIVEDTDEERSVHGSDSEEDEFPTFNATTDLKGEVKLFVGLKFDSIYILRKAVQHHSILKKYSYYYIQNGAGRFEVACRYKCDCQWNIKRGKFVNCHCATEHLKCHFKIRAVNLVMTDQYQIRECNLHHECGFFHHSNKITSSYLAERYLEDWKADPSWKLKAFMEKVYRDLGLNIGYYKAWFARARVKQTLYGDGADQYAKVYQYAFALLKYNPGSTVIVTVDNSDASPQPYFQRMYVCLEACKSGYKEGCRPIIGVDGCHLKGNWPGMILAAIGKDGNNNIFPIAWAIVEVENTESWTWFLQLLLDDTGHIEGEGLTLMSDRQKGLIDAIDGVAPKADVRFCVRHIWANFKLKFTGTMFKEAFWRAAKATTQYQFDADLQGIKYLNEEAFKYLDGIPAKHWSRHAFTPNAKSNMVTNNICETFNSVIREARDKPVITCMEWIRRYVMKRHAEKWQGVQSFNGAFMPYTNTVFGWIMEGAKHCNAVHSRTDEWEVDTPDDRLIVNLRERTCTCNHFMLTGIPCAHAWTCIVAKRERPIDYLHEKYSKETYLKAYASHIKPMPGYKHWEPCDQAHPLPPPFKVMPGRPSLKKRKKEVGEDNKGKGKKFKKQGGAQKCSNCGEVGHKNFKGKCKKPKAPTTTVEKPVNKGGRPTSNDPWVVATKKNKAARIAMMTYVHPTEEQGTAPQTSQRSTTTQGRGTPSTSASNASKKAPRKKLPCIKKKSLKEIE